MRRIPASRLPAQLGPGLRREQAGLHVVFQPGPENSVNSAQAGMPVRQRPSCIRDVSASGSPPARDDGVRRDADVSNITGSRRWMLTGPMLDRHSASTSPAEARAPL